MKTVEEVCDFLRTRRVSQAVISTFEMNKIDAKVLRLLNDNQLKDMGLTALGDICTLRSFCDEPDASAIAGPSTSQDTGAAKSRREKLLEILRKKSKRTRDEPGQAGRPKAKTRSVNFALHVKTRGDAESQRVKSPLGDKNFICVKITSTDRYEDVLKQVVGDLFPNGVNPVVGEAEKFDFEIVNSREENVSDIMEGNFTLEDYVRQQKIPGAIRLFLLAKTDSETGDRITSDDVGDDDDDDCDDEDTNVLPDLSYERATPSGEVSLRVRPASRPTSSEGATSFYERQMLYSDIIDISSDEWEADEDEENLTAAIAASLEGVSSSEITLEELIRQLQSQIKVDEPPNQINVARSRIIDGATRAFSRRRFIPERRLSIKFMDDIGTAEGAVDEGGPTREFLTLILQQFSEHGMFAGPDGEKMIVPFQPAREKDLYYICGLVFALSIVHIGQGPHFISTTLFDIIIKGMDETQPSLDDVYPQEIRTMLAKITNANSTDELVEAVHEAETFLSVAGVYVPIRKVDDKDRILRPAIHFQVVKRSRDCIERFTEGLAQLGVLEKIRQQPEAFRNIFCHRPIPLTSNDLRELFVPTLPENQRERAAITLAFWNDYLDDAEENKCQASLKDILRFITASEVIPPLGYSPSPSLSFHREGKYPFSSTCDCKIYLPLVADDFDTFKINMDEGILNSVGFGRA